MATIKIETGLKVYDIEDEQGNIRGQISFNPADVNLYPRAMEMSKKVQEYIKEINNLAENAELDVEIIRFDNNIKNEVNKLFDDSNASQVVFGNQNCFNTLNGVTFVERFLNAFMPIIEEEVAEQLQKSNNRIDEYLKSIEE